MYSGAALLPTPLAPTSRLLVPVLVVLTIPLEAMAKEPAAPPSVSCLDADGERYLQGLLDRIHQLEVQLDVELEARLTERAEAERKVQSVTNELTHQAAAALDPPREPPKAEGFDPEQAKKELASLKAALDEATAARRNAEAEAAAASKAAATFARALEQLEHRLAAAEKKSASATAASEQAEAEVAEVAVAEAAAPLAPPSPEPTPQAQAAEPAPTSTPALPSESERAAAQLAALMGKAPPPAPSDVRSTEAPKAPVPEAAAPLASAAPPPITVAAPAPIAATTTAPEGERAATQLAALQGRDAPPEPKPAPPSAAPGSAEGAGLGPAAARAALTRCDEPPDTVRIAPGDKVSIHVDHLKEVSRTVEVGSDGQIDLPLLGRVPAAGRNQRELVANLEQRLEVYLQAPRVDLALERACAR
jgi:hypothetical protein